MEFRTNSNDGSRLANVDRARDEFRDEAARSSNQKHIVPAHFRDRIIAALINSSFVQQEEVCNPAQLIADFSIGNGHGQSRNVSTRKDNGTNAILFAFVKQ